MNNAGTMARLLTLLVVCVSVAACCPAATPPTPASTLTPWPTAIDLATPPISPTPSPTRTPATPLPSPTPRLAVSPVISLTAPLVIDSESGRLYLTGVLDGVEQIVALSATDGQLLAAYGITGTFDVDPAHGWLYVDQAEAGLVVLNIQTGISHTIVSLPVDTICAPAFEQPECPVAPKGLRVDYPPQADPGTGQVLAFRNNVAYVIDPDIGYVVDAVEFDVPSQTCGNPSGPGAINWAEYDSPRRLLYLCFHTWFCTPHTGQACVAYDLDAGTEITRYDPMLSSRNSKAVAIDGTLYGTTSHWLHIAGVYFGSRWIWRDGQPTFISTGWDSAPDLYLDPKRDQLYGYSDRDGFQVLDAETMALLISMPSPVAGQLAGYDLKTDQLYFLSEGQLLIWPASVIEPPSPEPLEMVTLPDEPVRQLLASPDWPRDKTLFGLWGHIFDGYGGSLYISTDGGDTWGQPHGGLRGGPERLYALAVSPDYGNDHTILGNIFRRGVFKSTDGGQLWQPSSTGLTNMQVSQTLLSPGFERDHTAFVHSGGVFTPYRTTDGGATWQPLDVDLYSIAMSPEFDKDHTLMGLAQLYETVDGDCVYRGTQLLISRDGGDAWERTGNVPIEGVFGKLSIAPLSRDLRRIFAYGNGTVYQSTDEGKTWEAVLSSVPSAQLVYGLEADDSLSIFLLATDWERGVDTGRYFVGQSIAYRSEDGVNWQEVELPPGIVPTALAISPNFAHDSLLFVGTEDGRVVTLDVTTLSEGD